MLPDQIDIDMLVLSLLFQKLKYVWIMQTWNDFELYLKTASQDLHSLVLYTTNIWIYKIKLAEYASFLFFPCFCFLFLYDDVMKLLQYLQSKHHLARRKIIDYIKNGSISLNWKIVESYGQFVAEWDILHWAFLVNPEIISLWNLDEKILLMYHKPLWCTVSKVDMHNQTIYDILPKEFCNLQYVGRLDKNSTWLLLLTNDTALVHKLAHPSSNIEKIYEVDIDTELSEAEIKLLLGGIWVDENWIMVNWVWKDIDWIDFLKIDTLEQNESWRYVKLHIILKQGHKRHIRRILRAIWKRVISLHRIAFWIYTLADLPSGERKYIVQ